MGKKIRILLILVFLAGSTGFFYLHYQKQSEPVKTKTYWKFKIKNKNQWQHFFCKGGTPYTFKSRHGVSDIMINDRVFKSQVWENGNPFYFQFEKGKIISLYCGVDGFSFRSGVLEVWADKTEGPRLEYLEPDKYSDFYFSVSKGDRFNIPLRKQYEKQNNSIYVGYFRNGKLIKEILNIDNYDLFYGKPYEHSTFRFWEDYQLRFKSAETPLIWRVNFPYKEKAMIQVISKSVYFHRYEYNIDPVYLDYGEVKKMNIFLVKGDEVVFNEHESHDSTSSVLQGKIFCIVSNKNASWEYAGFSYKPQHSGYLMLKALSQVCLNKITIRRPGKQFFLKSGETEKIQVYSGDTINLTSYSNFYINDQLVEAGSYKKYISEDGYLSIKGGINTREYGIEYHVVSRKGGI